MAEQKKTSQVNPDEISVSGLKHFSLIDLLMIIMIVGLVSLAIFPKIQDGKNDIIIRNSLTKMQMIINANEDFKEVEDGDYALISRSLTLGDAVADDFLNLL